MICRTNDVSLTLQEKCCVGQIMYRTNDVVPFLMYTNLNRKKKTENGKIMADFVVLEVNLRFMFYCFIYIS